jgi:hypothetical protein
MLLTRRIAFLLLAAATLAAEITPGVYKGRFDGQTGGGAMRVEIRQKGEFLNAEVSFTYEGSEIKCKTLRTTSEDDRLDVTYRFDISGLTLESTLQARQKDRVLDGTYQTKAVGSGEQVDNGRWNVTRE